MSLSRAFTTRRMAKKEKDNTQATSDIMPKRSLTTKFPSGTNIRHKISAPIELISTTNMLSYNAPDIYPVVTGRSPSSSISSNSGDDSSAEMANDLHTPLTSPDTSSIESSSNSPTSPKPNHLSCYFGASTSETKSPAPMIPKRAPSHTKSKASVENFLARKNTTASHVSRKTSTSTARSSINMFASHIETIDTERASSPTPAASISPFSNELAQVSEIAEEYGISPAKLAVVDEEEQELVSRGLFKFKAEDYMSEIQGLWTSAFGEGKLGPKAVMWI